MKKILLTTASLLILQFSFAQTAPETAPGQWDFSFLKEAKGGFHSEENYSLTPAELTEFKQKMTDIAEAIHQNPVMKNPVGYSPTVIAYLFADMYKYDYKTEPLKDKRPIGEMEFKFCPLHADKTGKVFKNCIEVSKAILDINSPWALCPSFNNYKLTGTKAELYDLYTNPYLVFTVLPPIKKFDNGIILYDDGTLVIPHNKRPYFTPVTVKEMFEMIIPFWEEDAKKQGNTIFIDMVKQEYAAVPKDKLNLPAYMSQNPFSQVGWEPSDRPYYRFNPDYFDKTLPRTAIQLITIKVDWDLYVRGIPAELGMDVKRHREWLKQLDLEKLRSFIEVK